MNLSVFQHIALCDFSIACAAMNKRNMEHIHVLNFSIACAAMN